MPITPPTPLVTFESVASAAEAIKQDGKRPSVRTVIAHLGGGSPNAVLPYLNAWKAGRPVIRTDDIAVDPRIHQIIAEQIANAVADARADIAIKLEETEQDAEALAKAGREAEALIESLQNANDTERARAAHYAGQIERMQEEIDKTKAESTAAIDTAHQQQTRERQEREDAQQALAKATLRLEALPRLETEITRLHAALENEQHARRQAEQQAAVSEARHHAAQDELKGHQQRLRDQHATLAQLDERLQAEQQERLQAAQRAATAEAHHQAATKELADHKQRHQDQQATIAQLQERLQTEQQERLQAAQRAATAESTLETLRATTQHELDAANAQAQQATQKAAELRGQIHTLEKQLTAANKHRSQPASG